MFKSTLRLTSFFFTATIFLGFIPTGHADANNDPSAFRLMNYNIKGLPLPWLSHEKRYLRIIEKIKSLEGEHKTPHVLNLEEAMHKKTDLFRTKLSYSYFAGTPKKKGLRQSAGLKTLSSQKILETKEIVYSKCVSYDCLARKGSQLVRIELPGGQGIADIYSTHMQAGPSGDPITPRKLCDKIRAHQLEELIKFIQTTHNPNHYLFVIGDFNFRQYEPTYDRFVSALNLKVAALDCAETFLCDGATDAKEKWETMIDHQFYKSPENAEYEIRPSYFDMLFPDSTGGKQYSDHRAVLFQYQFDLKN